MQRHAERTRKAILVIASLAIGIAISGCTPGAAPDHGGDEAIFVAEPPDREAEATVMAHIELPPPSFEAPDVASFEIAFANIHRCSDRDFITIRVVNTGDFDFIWASEWLIFYWTSHDESDAMAQYNVEKPFMPDAGSCPSPEGHSNLLEPGDTAYIGVYLGFDFDAGEAGHFGDRDWEDIIRLVFYVELSTSEYPYSSSTRPRTLDISFIIKDMPDRTRGEPMPAAPPTNTPMPGIGG